MPKVDRFSAMSKDAQKTKKKISAETAKAAQAQKEEEEASRQAQEEEEADRKRQDKAASASKSGKAPKSSPANGAFAKASALDEDDEDDDYEEETVQATAAPTKSKKEEKEAKKKGGKEKKKSDMELLQEQEQEARKQRIKKRLMNMLMVGLFVDADKGENGVTVDNGKAKKQKKPPTSREKGSSWEGFSIKQFVEKYSGPLMMFALVVLLGIARVSEEGYSPDRSRDSEDNYYEVLGLARGADILSVRKAYKNLALTWHPDKNPDCEACAERFAKISKAYDTLSNPEKKDAYDSNKKAKDKLDAANSVELTAENFEATVLRSNEVWIVQVMDPNDGMCHSFHPVWEDISAKLNGVVRFARIDMTTNKRAADFLPQRVILMPMIYRFMRGSDPEPFMPVQGDRRSEEVDLARPFTRFVLGTYPEPTRFTDDAELQAWWNAGIAKSQPRVLMVGATPGGRATQNEGLMRVQKVAHVWGEVAEFAFSDQSTVAKALGKRVITQRGGTHQLLVSPLNVTSQPKTLEIGGSDQLPAALEEVMAKTTQDLVPVLTLRNYQQLCGPKGTARTYCLVFVSGPDSSSPQMTKALSELDASRDAYAQEMLDLASGDDENAVAEPVHIQPVRVVTSTSRWPWLPPAAGPHFSSMWAEAKYMSSFILELDTRRVGAVKTRSLADIFQQVAYDDLKLVDLPETVSFSRAFADPEVSLRKELMGFLTTVLGALITFLVLAVSVAVVPELEMPTICVAYGCAFLLLLVVYPPACRRFVSLFVGTYTSFF